MRRNKRGDDRLYISVKHTSYTNLMDLYRIGMDKENEVRVSKGLGRQDLWPFILFSSRGDIFTSCLFWLL